MTSNKDLTTLLERFLSSNAHGRRKAFSSLFVGLKDAMQAKTYDEAAAVLQRSVLPELDYTSAQSLVRIYKGLLGHATPPAQVKKLAILGSFTTYQLKPLIELFLFSAGIFAEIYEADYGIFRQEILDPESHLYEFEPDIIFIATSWRDLAHCPEIGDDKAKVQEIIESELVDWSALWQTAHERLGCQILQNNFVPPPWRILGNYEMRHPAGLGRFISQVNQAFQDGAPAFVTIHDVDHLAATVGLRAWNDERFFYNAKMPCAPEHLVDYAHSVASIISAQLGLSKKCLVLDLDNTLWGGVIGDDGLGGIRLGQGDPEGEAFLAFQSYAKALRTRGVVLAICSKNEESIAREAFEKHPEMVLRLEDISCFITNWMDKASNLRTIAKQLNITLNSLVFADDNPAERALVRQLAPEVAVPELPEDPAGYIQAVDQARYFQMISLGTEDLKRTDYYRANANRMQAQASAGNVDGFLKSLQMVACVGPIESATLERSVQLINKTNQFNLTTRRRSAGDVLAMMESANWITRTVSLADRFGDNGLISVLLASLTHGTLVIDTWLMSCRVFKRGVEFFLFNHLVDLARKHSLDTIRSEYIPTPKNALVKDFYAELGFNEIRKAEDGRSWWELSLPEDWKPINTFIEGKYNERKDS